MVADWMAISCFQELLIHVRGLLHNPATWNSIFIIIWNMRPALQALSLFQGPA